MINRDSDLIVEGARRKNGDPVTMVITRRVRVTPVVAATVRPAGSGFTYDYRVAKASGAKQWIQIFWIGRSD